MALHFDSRTPQERQPGIAKRRSLWQHQILSQLDAGPATGQQGRAIFQRMCLTKIASEDNGCVVKKTTAIRLFRGFESIQQSGQQFALRLGAGSLECGRSDVGGPHCCGLL